MLEVMISTATVPPGPNAHPILGHIPELSKNLLGFLCEIGHQYGDFSTYKLGRKSFHLVNHPELMYEILLNPRIVRSRLNRKLIRAFFQHGLLTQELEEHMVQRRLMQPAFHRERLQHYARVMLEETDAQIERFRRLGRVNFVAEMHELTFRIVSRALFSDTGGAADRVASALHDIQNGIDSKFSLYAALPDGVPVLKTPPEQRAVESLRHITLEIVQSRRADPTDRGDLLPMLLESRDEDGTGLTDDQIVGQAIHLLFAGHETTANALSWTFYLLSQHPEVMRRLQIELDEVLGSRVPTMSDMPRLKYAEMIVNEVLRLYPPAFYAERTPLEPVTIGPYTFKPGTPLVISVYVTQRDPRFFPNPDAFDPERFSEARLSSIPKYAFMPFGAGRHICIGNGFALTEARLLLARIAQAFDVRLAPDHKLKPRMMITLGIEDGLPLEMIPRTT